MVCRRALQSFFPRDELDHFRKGFGKRPKHNGEVLLLQPAMTWVLDYVV